MKAYARALVMLAAIAGVAGMPMVPAEDRELHYVDLPNRMRVIIAPDPTASSVVVHVRYQTGATAENVIQPGFTKLLEHLLSAGSVHVKDFDARIDAIGGWSTATTTSDYLAVTDQVPANALERVLWLEAERMAGLADGITDDAVGAARTAVDAEWRAAYVDEPYALATRELQRGLWTGEFAVHANAVLGDGNHAKIADPEAVRQFARERLAPNNAVLVVAGRLDAKVTEKWVRHYFGWIPMRQIVRGPGMHPILKPRDRAVELTVNDPVPKVVVAFRCEPFDPEIELAGRLLAGGSASRLQRLVDAKLATEVRVETVRQAAGELRIEATPAPGVEPTKLAAAMRAEIAKLRTEPPSDDEIARAKAMLKSEFLVAIENLAVRAEQLASWSAYSGGGPLQSHWPYVLGRVTAKELKSTFAHWLANTASVTVIGRPEAR